MRLHGIPDGEQWVQWDFYKNTTGPLRSTKQSTRMTGILSLSLWNQYYYNPLQLRQFNYKYSFGYAEWDEDQQRIRIGVIVVPSRREHPDAAVMRSILIEDLLTTDRCIDLLHDVKAGLLSLHSSPFDPARQMIMTWFSHNGQRVYSTSALDQIIAITNIKVDLSSEEGVSPDLECSQALEWRTRYNP